MALINSKDCFIFFHLFKCAGNSVRDVLNSNSESGVEIYGGHSTPRDIKQIMLSEWNEKSYNDYFKFTIIRNPFDWILSTYYYILAWSNHGYHEAVKPMTLAQFIEFYVNEMMLNKNVPLGYNKCVSLYDFITDNNGDVIVDFIGKFENLKEDMNFIFDKLNMERKELPFINVNPLKTMAYRDYYDETSKKLIEKHFAKDLEYFKYEF